MEDAPSAPAEAPKAPESEATPTTSPEPAQAPNLHGFTEDQLAEMRKFYDANGGFDKVKSKISNPQPMEKPVENPQPQQTEPTSQPQAQPVEQTYKRPEGSITAQEFLAQQYFQGLSQDPKYASIAEGIANGDYLKEMSAFGIQALNQDGSINDSKVRMYLDLKAQTVPAKQTDAEPSASAAPTVTYTEVGESGIANIEQAYKILMEPGSPHRAKAEEYIKNAYNKK